MTVDAAQFLRTVINLLDEARIPYMVAGSVVSSLYGDPRTTRDLDVVVEIAERSIEVLLSQLDDDLWYFDPSSMRDVALRGGMFNIIDMTSGWKVDVMAVRDRPFSREEFGRRVRAPLLGTEAWVATREDTVLAKLEWHLRGGSARQLEDVAGIVRLSPEIDIPYMQRWADELGIRAMLDDALS